MVATPTFTERHNRLKHLWEGSDSYSAIFLKYIKQLSSAIAMACLNQNHPPGPLDHQGWQPTATIHDKDSMLIGGLQPNEGLEYRFIQLYVMDRDHAQKENQARLATVTLPKSATTDESQVILCIINIPRQDLSNCNPYVHDLTMACQIFSQENPRWLRLVPMEEKDALKNTEGDTTMEKLKSQF